MKKLLILVAVLAVLWMVKITLDLYQLSAGQGAVQVQQNELEQRNASLNDQLAALNRQLGKVQPAAHDPAAEDAQEPASAALQPAALIEQQLDLVEFALQQRQYAVALEKLNELNHNLTAYPLAPALQASLHQLIEKDRQMILQLVNTEAEQQNKLKAVLDVLDREIGREIQAQYQQTEPKKEKSFWQRWIQIESVQQPNNALMQRSMILKETQLRLLLAQQLLQKGQYIAFQQEITLAIQTLKQLPDAKSKQYIQRLNELQKIPAHAAPSLNTRALIG